MFDGVVAAIKDTSSISKNSTVHMFGNVPVMSPELRHSIVVKRDTLNLLKELHGVKSTFMKIDQDRLNLYLYRPTREEDSLLLYALRPVDSVGFELILKPL
jgi:hypothetical protein